MPPRLALAFLAALSAAALVTAAPVRAQELAPGDRVRISLDGAGRLSGEVARIGADTLFLASDGAGAMRAVPLGTVRRLEVRRGRNTSDGPVLRGALIGGLAGGVAGALALPALAEDDHGCTAYDPCLSGPVAVGTGALAGGALGAVVGAVVGLAAPGSRWERVELGRPAPVSASVMPGAGGVRVEVRLSL